MFPNDIQQMFISITTLSYCYTGSERLNCLLALVSPGQPITYTEKSLVKLACCIHV